MVLLSTHNICFGSEIRKIIITCSYLDDCSVLMPCSSGMYPPLSLQADARCELCKFTLGLLDGVLKKDDPKLNQTLTNLCNSLPDTYKSIVCTLLFIKKNGTCIYHEYLDTIFFLPYF